MEGPLYAEIKEKVKEEPLGDYPQDVQAQVTGGHEAEVLEEKPNSDGLDRHFADFIPIHKKPPGSIRSSPPLVSQSTGSKNHQKPKQRIFYFAPVRRGFKRELPSEADEPKKVGNLSEGESLVSKRNLQSWEKAAGAQNAEDILRENEEPVVKEEVVGEEDELSEEQPGVEPVVGDLPFNYRRATKRLFSGEGEAAVNEGNLPNGKGQFSAWERASGAQKAEDIMREIDTEEGPVVKVEECEEEDEKSPPSEEPGVEPFVGDLPFILNCPKCGEGFHIFEALQSHMGEEHPGWKPLWCLLCPKMYEMRRCYWTHMRKAHGVKAPPDHPAGYLCNECGGQFLLRESYAYHCHVFRGKPHNYCQPCKEAVHLCNWDGHLMTTKHRSATVTIRVRYACRECERQFGSYVAYEEHRESLKKKPHAFCLPCWMVLDAEEWENHQMAMGHSGVKPLFYCCNVVVRPEEWEEHRLMGHKEREP